MLDEALRVDDLAQLPLAEFAQGSRVVEFACPFAPVTMLLVPHPRFIPALTARGIPRGRMWLADEVRDLINAHVTRDDLAKIVEAKLLLDGFVAGQERGVA